MKWGRKKHSPPSPRSLLITRVCPVSWFSKFKQKCTTSESSSDKKQQRGKLDFPTRNSSLSAGWREAIFCSVVDDDDDDAFWSLSLDETRKKKGRINLLWYDSADEFHVPVSGLKSFGLRGRELPRGVHRSISDVVMDIEKMKEKQSRQNILREIRKKKPNQGARDVNHQRSRKLREKAQVEKGDDNVFAEMEGEGRRGNSESVSIPKCQNLDTKRSRDIKAKSSYTGRRSHSRKTTQIRTKAYGPKTDCRIQVLENMKNGRKELKKRGMKEQAMKFNSFAAVKSSYNPEEDFRDSMVEMISYKGIKRPEELEELLACYLTLNPDDYHDLIVKVFQQVWFELNRGVC
ncbi:hypothetical protein ACS0TY_031516 [Phlomoides rotata]